MRPHATGAYIYAKVGLPRPKQRDLKRRKKMYAIIETGGKQYKVQEGDTVYVELLKAEAHDEITLDSVVALGTDDGIKVGAPYVDGASVSAKVVKNGKAKKITVMTYKPKKNEKRT